MFFFNKFSNIQISLEENVCIKICFLHKLFLFLILMKRFFQKRIYVQKSQISTNFQRIYTKVFFFSKIIYV